MNKTLHIAEVTLNQRGDFCLFDMSPIKGAKT